MSLYRDGVSDAAALRAYVEVTDQHNAARAAETEARYDRLTLDVERLTRERDALQTRWSSDEPPQCTHCERLVDLNTPEGLR